MKPAPLVSVIVPVFNCERFIGEALTSIFAQEHRPLDIIVVDDGSSDGSAAVAKTFPEATLISQPNGGVGSARNAGLAAARGEIIAWLDADDVWLPGKLTAEVRHLADNPSTGMTLCHQRMFVTPGEAEPDWLRAAHMQKWLTYSLYATAIRREVSERVGPFNTAMRTGEDFDWYMRARELDVRLDFLDAVLVAHRVRPGSLTGDARGARRDLLQVARTSLNRRRASSFAG